MEHFSPPSVPSVSSTIMNIGQITVGEIAIWILRLLPAKKQQHRILRGGYLYREEDSMETMRIILLKHLQNMKKVLGLLFKNSGWD